MSGNCEEIHLDKLSKKYNVSNFNLYLIEGLAIKTLSKTARYRLKMSRDNIDFVMSCIVRGYTTYNPNLSSLRTYLILKAKLAIKTLLSKKNKQHMNILSLDKEFDSGYSRKDLIAERADFKSVLDYKDPIDYIESAKV